MSKSWGGGGEVGVPCSVNSHKSKQQAYESAPFNRISHQTSNINASARWSLMFETLKGVLYLFHIGCWSMEASIYFIGIWFFFLKLEIVNASGLILGASLQFIVCENLFGDRPDSDSDSTYSN